MATCPKCGSQAFPKEKQGDIIAVLECYCCGWKGSPATEELNTVPKAIGVYSSKISRKLGLEDN